VILLLSALIAVPQPSQSRVGTVIHARGAGELTCATAFLAENRVATENWIAGYWVAWDMSQILWPVART
jgi:hypothetical protein